MRKAATLLLLAGSLIVAALIAFNQWANKNISLPENIVYTLEPGRALSQISSELIDLGVNVDPNLFYMLAKFEGVERSLRAGTYDLPVSFTPKQLIRMFALGEVKLYDFRINEGWSYRDLVKELSQNPNITHTLKLYSIEENVKRLGVAYPFLEGVFFPDTYSFENGTQDIEILRRSYKKMQHYLEQLRSTGRNLDNSTVDLLTLASLIEKETGLDEDRPLVSQVFHKRLRKKMRLQTDPSVIFALGDKFDGNLTRKHLRLDSPYNTYRRKGLPPSPIAYPSEASLTAAVNPASTDYLYFVSRGDGSSQFSKTLREHNRAVRKYQLRRGKD
ncbi:MAG: endolytic transglycosylase MltG [Candidatus Azotimanducaceae bacterium]